MSRTLGVCVEESERFKKNKYIDDTPYGVLDPIKKSRKAGQKEHRATKPALGIPTRSASWTEVACVWLRRRLINTPPPR